MEFLGEATNKAVLLTMENSPKAVIFRYSPNRKEVEWVGPAYG